jgi:diguanylate cyclase (GGDEF)-like protein
MPPSPAVSIVSRVASACRTTAERLFPLGIVARLTLSLLAVAVLAAAANMVAREGATLVRFRDAPRPLATRVTAAVTPIARPEVPPAAAVRDLDRRHTQEFAAAIGDFERAVHARAENHTGTTEAEYQARRQAMRRLLVQAQQAEVAGSWGLNSMVRRGTEYLAHGDALVLTADERRLARTQHSARCDAIDARIQRSLDGAWTIFGRVLARQSLIQLHTDLIAIRQRSESLVSGDTLNSEDNGRLLAAEKAFAESFADHEKGFEKSDGIEWVKSLREDFQAVVALRGSLQGLNARYDEELDRLSHAHAALATALAQASENAPRIIAAPASAQPTTPLASAATAPAADTVAEQVIARPERDVGGLMALVTVIMLLFITVISIFTVRAILMPVRRMLKATSALAAGHVRVQVTRGGVRELDTLAGAFNEMATKLAAAHDLSRIQQDTLEEKILQRTHKLQQLAQRDPLTSLPNRRHLSTLLNAAIEQAAVRDRHLGVYFLDIDNFKNFNDSLGHVFGDRVLMSVANRLEEIADGMGFVARLGGDEFTFVYEDAESVAAVHALGEKLVRGFQQRVSVDDRELSISVSVGASVFPDHGRDAEGLLRAADSALFRAKELGRSQLALFTPELIESAATRFSVEQGLRLAIDGSQFELLYQPEINLATFETGLVEALLRWRMPDGRLAAPGEFLAVAEQSGLISEISTWVLRTAVRDAARWYHGEWPQARVAVNISPRQLLDHRFVEHLLELLQEFDLPAKCIELELTETVVQTGASTVAALRELHSHGFGIALDDFGTGYSSLTSLEQLPLSRIKLDRSLIAGIDCSARAEVIARAIIELCAGLGLEVTAEGIERPEQLQWLLANRAIFVQGFLFSHAVPFDEVLHVQAALANKIDDILLSVRGPPTEASVPRMGVLEVMRG